jgi:hypothetical protein
MTKVFIAGSRKFYSQINDLVIRLKEVNVVGLTPMKEKDLDDFEQEKKALLKAFDLIGDSDYVYVVAEEGYVGKAVAMEMAYAYAKKVKIISSEEVKELSARALVSEVKDANKFVLNLKSF